MNKESLKNFFREHWLFLCILVFAIGLRILYASPGMRYVGTDLSLQAYNILHGDYNINHLWYHLGVRYVMLLLVTGVYAILGISETSAMIVPFCASIGTIIIIYLLGISLFSRNVGLIAAFFLAIFPLDVFNATILETDGTMTFFTVLAMFLYYYLRTKEKNPYLFIYVGIIVALSALTKIFGALMLFSIGIYELLTFAYKDPNFIKRARAPFLRLLAIGFGFALIYTPLILWQYHETGDFFYNIHVEKDLMFAITQFKDWPKANYNFIPVTNDYMTYLNYMFYPRIYQNFQIIRPDDGNSPMLNIFFYFIFISSFYFLYKREDKTTFLLCWFLIPFLFLENYYFIVKVQRYLTITLVPSLLLSSYFLYTFFTTKFSLQLKKSYVLFFCFILIFISVYQLGKYTLFNPYAIAGEGSDAISVQSSEEIMAHLLKSVPEKDVYVTNYQTIPILNFYFQYSKNYSGPHGYTGSTTSSFYDLHFVGNYSQIHDAYVIMEPHYFQEDIDVYNYYRYYNATYPLVKQHIPENWQLLYQDPMNQFLIFYAN